MSCICTDQIFIPWCCWEDCAGFGKEKCSSWAHYSFPGDLQSPWTYVCSYHHTTCFVTYLCSASLQVYYSFKPIFMLAEPLMLASAFLLFFVACVAYLHIDLSIRKWQVLHKGPVMYVPVFWHWQVILHPLSEKGVSLSGTKQVRI